MEKLMKDTSLHMYIPLHTQTHMNTNTHTHSIFPNYHRD